MVPLRVACKGYALMRLFSGGFLLAVVIVVGGALPVTAQPVDFTYLGNGRLLNNDVIGDGNDRWRTGSYSVSLLYGSEWQGNLTTSPRDVIEFRLRGEVISPANVTNPALNDRLYAGVLAFGVHSHFTWRGADIVAGADVLGFGPQTGIRELQRDLHEALSQPVVNSANRELQNKTLLDVNLEASNDYALGAGTFVRPFIGLAYGAEDLVRLGVDVTVGQWGQGGLRLRDPITGHRFSGIASDQDNGLSLVFGADWAYVDDSEYLPSGHGAELRDDRHRLRGGVHYGQNGYTAFYGVTYLSPEFGTQPDGQMVGSVSLGWNF